MQLIQLLKSPVTVAVLAVFHDLMIVSLTRAKIFGSLGDVDFVDFVTPVIQDGSLVIDRVFE
jgi:hypothetical protein